MKILFLGTGPAKPVIKKNEKRTNSSILVDGILIDCTPQFLMQAKRENIKPENIKGILITHAHKDAIGGLGDFDKWINREILIFVPRGVNINRFVKDFKFLKPFPVKSNNEYNLAEVSITPFRLIHYEYHPTLGKKFPAYGYKINDLVYAEDMEKIPENSIKYFEKAETIIADGAMWFGRQIRGHLSVDKTLLLAKRFNPKNLIIIQAGRTYPPQESAEKEISDYWNRIKEDSKTNVKLSYDGLSMELKERENSFLDVEEETVEELGAFGSPGGKTHIVSKLIQLVPEHKIYVEPFAGGAALFWKKEKAEKEVLSDLDEEIADAYKFIKNLTEEQLERLRKMKWKADKSYFFKLRDYNKIISDPVKRFYKFFYVHFHSYGGSRKTFGYLKKEPTCFDKYLKYKERLQNVKVFNLDYEKVIKHFDSKDTFIYMDPPYPGEWPGKTGTKAWGEKDIQRLHLTLKSLNSKWLLSINDLPWIRNIFSDFNISTILVPRKFKKGDEPKKELLISNYTIKKEMKEEQEMIKDIAEYDPSKVNNLQLADDWRIVNAWYSVYKKTDGKGIKFSKEDIINIAKLIYNEITKRVKEEKMKHEFDPEKMKNSSLELYKIVSRDSVIMSDWSDLKFLEDLDDFLVIKDCISLIGSSVTQEHNPNDIDLLVRMNEPENKFLKRAIEVRISKMMPENLQDKLHFVWGEKEGPHDSFIPLFDLQFKKIKPTKLIAMAQEKPKLFESYFPQKPYGSAFYDLDRFIETIMKGIKNKVSFSVEEKLNGFHVSVHVQGKNIKIFSEQKKDITKAFPTLSEAIKSLSNIDFIIDGELVPYDEKGNILGRNALMKYIGAIRSGKTPDDRNIKIHIWDIIYFGKDLTDLPLSQRLEFLSKLKFNKRSPEVKRKIVESELEKLKKAINWASTVKGSEGAVVKNLDAPYFFGEHSSWRKYRKLTSLIVSVLKKIPKKRNLYNYLVGVESKGNIDKKYIKDGKLVLGHTFNTNKIFNISDKIEILVEEVWRHKSKDGIHYSIHKPRVADKTNRPLSTIDSLEDAVTSIGIEVIHTEIYGNKILISEDLAEAKEPKDEGKEIEIKNFPDRMQENFNNLINKWSDYGMQVHTRGNTLHYDIRHLVKKGLLEGITLFGRSVQDRLPIETQRNNIRSTIKTPQPPEWLTFEGVTRRGEVGATKRNPGVFTIISKGKFTVHEVTDHKIVIEYKSDSGSVNKKVKDYAEKENLPYPDLPEKLIDLTGVYSWHIAHIGEHYIILFDKLKQKI